ncbi:MAG: methanogenesis marker 3 protein [Methanolobus sp.]
MVYSILISAQLFISDHRFHGELVTYENFEPRSTGSVFVRTVGYGAGKLYISTDDRTSSIMHSVVGHVVKGIELTRIVENGQKIMVESTPSPIRLLGMTNADAEEKLRSMGIEIVRDGYTDDNGFIVKQEPATTLEIMAGRQVTVQGVDPEMLVTVELYDDLAPKTLDFFRHAVGLQYHPVSKLPVMMTYENTYIFKAEKPAESYKEIFPENIPKMTIAGEIGVTNQAAKRAGMVGVKAIDDDLFGPAGEKFANTNIIGRIVEIDKTQAFQGWGLNVYSGTQQGGISMAEANEDVITKLVVTSSDSVLPIDAAMKIYESSTDIVIKETCFGTMVTGPRESVNKVVNEIVDLDKNHIFVKERGFPLR